MNICNWNIQLRFRAIHLFGFVLVASIFIKSHLIFAQKDNPIQIGDTIIGNQLNEKATQFTQSGNFDSAIYYLGRASGAYEKAEAWDKFFYSHSQVGYLLSRQNRLEESFHHLDSIETGYAKHLKTSTAAYAQFYRVLAWNQFNLVNYQEALHYFSLLDKGIASNQAIDISHVLFSHYYQGVIYQRIGQYDRALKYMLRILELSDETGDTSYLGPTYNNLGIIYRNLGEYERALEFYKKSLAISKRTRKEINLTPIYNNIGRLHYELGEYELALEELNQALDILTSFTSKYYQIESALYNTKALVLIELGDYRATKTILNNLLEREVSEYGKLGIWSSETLTNSGRLLSNMGQYEKAKEYYLNSIEILRKDLGNKNDKQAEVLNLLGKNHLKEKNYEKALEAFQQGIISLVPDFSDHNFNQNPDINSFVLDKVELLESEYLKTKVLMSLLESSSEPQYLEAAINSNRLAAQLVELVRTNMLYESSKIKLSKKAKEIYEQTIELTLLSEQELSEASTEFIFNAMENSKAFLLSESLQRAEALGYTSLPDSIKNKEDNLRTQIQLLETQRANAELHNEDSTKLKSLNQQLFSIKEEFEFYKQSLHKNYKNYLNARYNFGTPKISEVKEYLRSSEILVEFFTGDSELYAIAVSKENVKVYSLGKYHETLEAFVSVLKKSQQIDAQEFQYQSNKTYRLILKPILDDFKDYDDLIIIPDAQIGYIPFDALVATVIEQPNYASLSYLLMEYTISQHQSATLYLNNQEREANSYEPFIGFAPGFNEKELTGFAGASRNKGEFQYLQPLPFAKKEVEVISGLLQGEVAIDTLANEHYFKKSAGEFAVLHVASHAIINEENPLFSKLIFSKGDSSRNEDGFLHSFEIYGLNLDCKLVTLSACNTGSGKYLDGEGIFSLGRGFLMAGARSVLTSLWEVSDQSTSEIMESFYANLSKGQSMPVGLRKAKLDYLKNADHLTANPYYWAGFVYIGKPESLYSSERNYYWAVFFALLAVGIWYWKRKGKDVVS